MDYSMNKMNDTDFGDLIKKMNAPKAGIDLTNRVMEQVLHVERQRVLLNRYKKLAWFFASLAILFSLKLVSLISTTQTYFSQWLNSLIPGLSDAIVYLAILSIAAIILFELNLLLADRFTIKPKGSLNADLQVY